MWPTLVGFDVCGLRSSAKEGNMASVATYLRKDLLPAEGGGQDQEGEDEPVQSAVWFNHRQNLGRTAQSAHSTVIWMFKLVERKENRRPLGGARKPHLGPAPAFPSRLIFLYGLHGAEVVAGHLAAFCRALFTHAQLNPRLHQQVYGQVNLRGTTTGAVSHSIFSANLPVRRTTNQSTNQLRWEKP